MNIVVEIEIFIRTVFSILDSNKPLPSPLTAVRIDGSRNATLGSPCTFHFPWFFWIALIGSNKRTVVFARLEFLSLFYDMLKPLLLLCCAATIVSGNDSRWKIYDSAIAASTTAAGASECMTHTLGDSSAISSLISRFWLSDDE